MDSLHTAPQSPFSSTVPIPTAPPPSAFPMAQSGMAMVSQGGWSPPNTICPPGLEYLMGLSYLHLRKRVVLTEAFVEYEAQDKYTVTNVKGEPLFYVAEQSGICGSLCFGIYRSCEFYIVDNNKREVLHMIRPTRCDVWFCPCDLQELEVYSSNTLLGSLKQNRQFGPINFSIRNASGETVLIIKAPWMQLAANAIYKIKSVDGKHKIGFIKKERSGVDRGIVNPDCFGVTFPVDLDVKIKAVLLGACIFLDFMHFELMGRVLH